MRCSSRWDRALGCFIGFFAIVLSLLAAPSEAAPLLSPGFDRVVIFATNSVNIDKNTTVTGDVAANESSPGPTLAPGFEVKIQRDVQVTGDVKGDSVGLGRGVVVTGTVTYNELDNGGSIGGSATPLALPVFPDPPAFQEALVPAGVSDVTVGAGQTVELEAGDYGDITVGVGGRLMLLGGLYNVRSVIANGAAAAVTGVEFTAPTDLRIEGRFDVGRNAFVGPQAGSGIGASRIVIFVGATNGGDGTPNAQPPAAIVGRDATVAANIYAHNGTLQLGQAILATGAFLARDVQVGSGGVVTLDTFFVNPEGAEIAGNVADADGDGFGDNHNELPGPAPVLMSAAVDVVGGAGNNGVVRMQIEWDITGLAGLADDLASADVLLHTSKGSIDSLDTFFFVGTGEQDGALTDGDFEAPAVAIPGVVMAVPSVPIGTKGTFSFDVKDLLIDAILSGRSHFSIQGRVDETLAGTGAQRGLQVYTTATANLDSVLHPQLLLTTSDVTASPLSFSIVSLP